ncbi:ComEA family DNA-binding protein [Phytoactinopolyspora halotolerans]|uniref:ComEA family DNA-binding protein n=1 Tax=Phytoactinopolyspora halotolerans TaxID=1981512 RepID=A0A6L9S5T6_9ACTN|nr:ComEA family DNA-binding protein [Phytoactinopolyspora halotolerans]NED99861.1 ComEA family DNA-binding protein [Phytoactinopolyspora halotolerans]
MSLPVRRRSADEYLTHVVRERLAHLGSAPATEAAEASAMLPRQGKPLLRDSDRPIGGWVPRVPDRARAWSEAAEQDEGEREGDPEPEEGGDRRVSGGETSAAVADRTPLVVRSAWDSLSSRLARFQVEFGRGQVLVVIIVVAVGLAIAAVVYGLGRPTVQPVDAELAPSHQQAEDGLEDNGGSEPDGRALDGHDGIGLATEADGPPAEGDHEASAGGGQADGAAGSAPGRDTLVVHVAGKVADPGVVTLPAGSRVVDAIEAAGGADDGVDLTPLNLARVLSDGEQVLVGVDPPPGGEAAGSGLVGDRLGPDGSAPEQPGPISLNTATAEQLQELPGIGPALSQRIIDWREQNGRFSSAEELLEVSGIGPSTFEDIAPLVAP